MASGESYFPREHKNWKLIIIANGQLSEEARLAAVVRYDTSDNPAQTADERIQRFKMILSEMDELQTELNKVRRIGEIVKNWKARIDAFDNCVWEEVSWKSENISASINIYPNDSLSVDQVVFVSVACSFCLCCLPPPRIPTPSSCTLPWRIQLKAHVDQAFY